MPRAVLHCSSIASNSSLWLSLLGQLPVGDWLRPLSLYLQSQSGRMASGETAASSDMGLLSGLDVCTPPRWMPWAAGDGVEVRGPLLHPGGGACAIGGEAGRFSPDPPGITGPVGPAGGVGGFQSGGDVCVVGRWPGWDFFPVHCGSGVLAGTGGSGQDTGATSGGRGEVARFSWRAGVGVGTSTVGDVGGVWNTSGWPPRKGEEQNKYKVLLKHSRLLTRQAC